METSKKFLSLDASDVKEDLDFKKLRTWLPTPKEEVSTGDKIVENGSRKSKKKSKKAAKSLVKFLNRGKNFRPLIFI